MQIRKKNIICNRNNLAVEDKTYCYMTLPNET